MIFPFVILKRIAFQSILLLLIVFLYRGTLSYPYIQDDWRFLYYFDSTAERMSFFDYCTAFFISPNETFYRPFGWLYFYFIIHFFEDVPIAFRILNLLVLFSCSLAFQSIAFRLLKNEVLAWICAAWFAFSGTVLMDPLMWMVGMYDLGALFFFLCSFLFFMKEKQWLSAICYFAALLFKEGAFFLPVILLGYSILTQQKSYRNILPHVAVMLLYSLLWFTSAAATEKHAYQVEFWGIHLITNFFKYGIWTVEGLTGRTNLHENWLEAILISATAMAVLLAIYRKILIKRESLRLILLLVLWGGVCLLPVIFLPNHAYRYYLMYSYPAFILLLVVHFNLAFSSSLKQNRIAALILLLLYFANLATLNFYFRKGLKAPVLSGSNALVQRGETVQLMLSYVQHELKKAPVNSVFIFDGVDDRAKWFRGIDPVAFRGANLLRYVYHDRSIDYITLRGNIYEASRKKVIPQPEKTVVLGLKEGKIKRYTLEDLYNPNSTFYTDQKW